LVAAVLGAAVSALGAHLAAAQAQTGGTVAAWGDNDFSRGGRGAAPAGLSGAAAISGGDCHSLAIPGTSPRLRWPWTTSIYDVDEDDTLDIAALGVLDNDSDANSDALTAGVADDAQHGMRTLDPDGSITYAPDSNLHGTDTFTYEVCDGGDPALCNSATVTMTVIFVPDVCTSDGTGKDDVLRGTYRCDVICGGGDTSCSRGANVLLRGAAGDDTVRGDEGDHRPFGGAGTDLLTAGSG
jgi:VCBS repeat-containing protein